MLLSGSSKINSNSLILCLNYFSTVGEDNISKATQR